MAIQDILNKLSSELFMKNMRRHIVDGLEQVYKDATAKGDTNMEVLRARGSSDSLNDRLDIFDKNYLDTTNALSQKASINYVDALLMDIAKGGPNSGPNGPFMSITALNSYEFPDGKEGTWLVFDSTFSDGAHSFMWDSLNSIWKDLGLYQSVLVPEGSIDTSKIAKEAVTTDKTDFASGETNLINAGSIVSGSFYSDYGTGTPVTLKPNVGYSALKVPVKELQWHSMNIVYSINFSYFVDAAGNSISKISEATSKDSNIIFQTPVGAKYLMLSGFINDPLLKDLSKMILIEGRKNIEKYSVADYPFGVPKNIVIPNLTVNGEDLEDAVRPSYSLLENKKGSLTNINDNWVVFSAGIKENITNGIKWTGKDAFKGIRSTNNLKSNADKVRVTVVGYFTGLTKVDLMLTYTTSTGALKYELMDESTDTSFSMTFDFDPNNYAVYKDMVSFDITVRNAAATTSNGSFVIAEYITNELDVETLSIYDPELKNVLKKIDTKLNAVPESKPTDNVFFRNSNGSNFKLQVDPTGKFVSIPTVPNKSLVMANSLAFGISDASNPDGAFGMCASDYTKDFYYLLKQEIIKHNPSATFDRLHVGNLEQGVTQTDYNNYILENDSKFAPDLDLIILQIGDNVGTLEKEAYFSETMPKFMKYVRNKCPNARIIAVSGWFGVAYSIPIMAKACADYGVELIITTGIRRTETEGYEGQIITFYDGSTRIAPSNWITHPGDLGMSEIAESIITQMNM